MGGKTSTSTQQQTIPPAVLAQYQAVNARANQTANTPFQTYSGQFVAPVNAQQTSGINATNQYAQEAQPYFGAATDTLQSTQAGVNPVNQAALGLTGAAAGPVNAQQIGPQQIAQFENPYLGQVLGSTAGLINQNNQQQQAGQLGTAITSGAFGGDRTGIAAANLEQQQNLANANIYSGIASNAFNTALGAAQQQQGVNLGAQQANRQALLASGQQLAGIGSTAYGEGANTASELGSLGTGAESAGLAGAQAQIGAGTLQQQTQQAQDTALYNQFLQQQSYPFQVGSWLAGIAEGTGSLSGSTTTTQQPGGFFSDERLKEDKEVIGKTFDGQPIYSYKMKGDPRTRIGLIAQDVEHKHPEAVGVAGHYKVVDYGKATKEAANRGHFYEGGVVPFRPRKAVGGVSNSELAQILAAQAAMYGQPAAGGTSGVYGGAGRVPASTAPIGHLSAPSGGLRPQQSPLQQATQMADLGSKGYGLYQKIAGSSTPTASSESLAATGDTMQGDVANALENAVPDSGVGAVPQFALGGAPYSPGGLDTAIPTQAKGRPMAGVAGAVGAGQIRPGGYPGDPTTTPTSTQLAFADGGMPYSDPGELDIPDENQRNQLTQAPALPSSGSGGGSSPAMQYVGDALRIAGLVAAFAKRGGRIGKDDGGELSTADIADPDTWDDTPPAPRALRLWGTKGANSITSGPQTPSTPDVNTDMGGQDFGVRGSWDTPQVPAEASGVAPSSSTSAPSDEPVRYTGGVGLDQAPPLDAGSPSAPNYSIADRLSVAGGNILDKIKQLGGKNGENIVPILAALGAMGTAPTRSWGTALAAGVGAGAKSYMDTQQQQAQIAQRKAGAQLTQQQAYNAAQQMAPNPQTQVLPGPGPDGKYFLDAQGKPAHYALKASLTDFSTGVQPPAGAGPTKYSYLGSNGQARADQDFNTLFTSEQAQPGSTQAQRAISAKTEEAINDRAGASYAQGGSLSQLANEISSLDDKGFIGGDALTPLKMEVAKNSNAVIRTLGNLTGVDTSGMMIGEDDLRKGTAINKISAQLQFAQAHGADQNSLGALGVARDTIPGNTLTKDQAIEVLSGLYVDKQKALDESNYLNEYKQHIAEQHPAQAANYLAQDARNSFRADHPDTQYASEKAFLKKLMYARGPDGQNYLPKILNKQVPSEWVNKVGAQQGIKDPLRYLENR